MLILNTFHSSPLPESLQQLQLILQKGRERVIFQLLKQRSYFCSNFALHASAQRQFFGARQYMTPITMDLKGNTAMPLITLLLAGALQQHTQDDRNWRTWSWIQSRRCERVSINTILHDLRKIFRSGINLACSQSPLPRITPN